MIRNDRVLRPAVRRALALVLSAVLPAAARAATVEVRVSDPDGKPVAGASVSLIPSGREARSGADGLARLENVSPGEYDVAVRGAGFAPSRTDVRVAEGPAVIVPVKLSAQVHLSESVTVSPSSRDTFESYQPATVLGGDDLQQRLGNTLGATLANEPGVNVRSFGSGNARPVVRGLDNDRVLILENGARTGDLSSQSADHGVTLDPATASQIEVVRGPATLLYGSSAIGGVVNLVNDEIIAKPLQGLHGAFTLQGATADENGGVAGNISGGNGRFAYRVNGSAQRTDDYDTPEGKIPNSQSNSKSGGGSLAATGENGYLGASYQYVDTRYGVPFVEEGETTLHPRRQRVDVRGERRNLGGFISGVKFLGGFRDYKHDEIEGSGEIATSFKNRVTEGNLYLNHRAFGPLTGTFGLRGEHRDYSAAGEEALAPPTIQNTVSGFLYEELRFRHASLQLGGRVDHTSFDPDGAAIGREGVPAREFTNFSASVGLLGYLRDDVTVALNLARAARNPSLEELYNFGPHAGNFAYEIGDPTLSTEVAYGADLSLRYRSARFHGEGTVFYNRIDGFIFPFQTGEIDEEEGLPVVEFTAKDSRLAGFEAHVDAGLTDSLWLVLGGDAVRGAVRDGGGPLPRIPPYRLWAGLRFTHRQFHLEGEVKNVGGQTRVYGAETPTDGYTVVNLHASFQITSGHAVHTVTARADNLGDELYRNHLSYIKDLAPEMGRSFRLVYAVRF
ncbi:MAG: TonB-dependent receptor [Vicinamibacteria bacterium]